MLILILDAEWFETDILVLSEFRNVDTRSAHLFFI